MTLQKELAGGMKPTCYERKSTCIILASLYIMNLNSRKWSWNKKEGAKESEELIPVESLLGLYDLEGI